MSVNTETMAFVRPLNYMARQKLQFSAQSPFFYREVRLMTQLIAMPMIA